MKLLFDVEGKNQPDPFIFADGGRFYLYVTAHDGVEAYAADDLFGVFHYEGIVAAIPGACDFWAPSVIAYGGRYYMYVSCYRAGMAQYMHVLSAEKPLGPFSDPKCLYDRFSIDSHVVLTASGLFLWYAQNNEEGDRIGTRVYVDRLTDPYTPENDPREMILPTFDEEIFTPQYREDCRWHTVEGPFWLEKDGWQYVMYSGGCYQDDTYHVGYACAKTGEADHKKLDLIKHTNGAAFSPVLIKNEWEEGTGHHSVICHEGVWYAVYHARDYGAMADGTYTEARTARICRLHIENGIITAERYPDHL